jgi:hypothetical protein
MIRHREKYQETDKWQQDMVGTIVETLPRRINVEAAGPANNWRPSCSDVSTSMGDLALPSNLA